MGGRVMRGVGMAMAAGVIAAMAGVAEAGPRHGGGHGGHGGGRGWGGGCGSGSRVTVSVGGSWGSGGCWNNGWGGWGVSVGSTWGGGGYCGPRYYCAPRYVCAPTYVVRSYPYYYPCAPTYVYPSYGPDVYFGVGTTFRVGDASGAVETPAGDIGTGAPQASTAIAAASAAATTRTALASASAPARVQTAALMQQPSAVAATGGAGGAAPTTRTALAAAAAAPRDADKEVWSAVGATERRDYASAIASVRSAVQANPEALAGGSLSHDRATAQRIRAAAAIYEGAPRKLVSDADARFMRAALSAAAGDQSAARVTVQSAIASGDKSPAMTSLARALGVDSAAPIRERSAPAVQVASR